MGVLLIGRLFSGVRRLGPLTRQPTFSLLYLLFTGLGRGFTADYGWITNPSVTTLRSTCPSYVNNSEWDLLSVRLKRNVRTHSCCTDPHPDMTYVFHIRRKTFYYIFNIIVPCVMLSTLTLLTFWLPPTSGEKITLGLSVFLAFSMFMLLIAEEVPATSEAVSVDR